MISTNPLFTPSLHSSTDLRFIHSHLPTSTDLLFMVTPLPSQDTHPLSWALEDTLSPQGLDMLVEVAERIFTVSFMPFHAY